MISNLQPVYCANCNKPVKGRTDKKFCDDWCRNAYNNQQSSQVPPLIRQVNNTLKRNRKLLQSQIPEGKSVVKIHRKKLSEQGFSFDYFTSLHTTQKGATYYFCYEYGYLLIENDCMLVVNRTKTGTGPENS